jgi:protein tyrosine/serine phosphatase
MAREAAVCEAAGVEMVRLPMSGDGRGDYAQYDQAMAILADSNRLPALVHCARGTHRTGALVASWRVQAEGWDPAAAVDEMTQYRFRPEDHVLVPHLQAYWNQRAGAQTPRPDAGKD